MVTGGIHMDPPNPQFVEKSTDHGDIMGALRNAFHQAFVCIVYIFLNFILGGRDSWKQIDANCTHFLGYVVEYKKISNLGQCGMEHFRVYRADHNVDELGFAFPFRGRR